MSDSKILVIDDEIHIVQVVAIKLKNNGFDVYTAENGSEGLKIAQDQQPDIIITDHQMPGLTGIEVIEKLRADQVTSHIPVIMLTARGYSIDSETMEQLDIVKFLSKPFSPREVLSCVEEVLEQRVLV